MPDELHRLHAVLHACCAGKPYAVEMRFGQETFFRARGRVFAFINSPRRPAITVRVSAAERGPLLRHPSVTRARWIGWLGWVTVSVQDRETLDLAVELIDRSYALVTVERRR
jgi:predicted DNA-binding protein (MmcQ/YjbR family)